MTTSVDADAPVILLLWNRDRGDVWPRKDYDAARRRIERTGKPETDRWNVGRHTAIEPGSACFLFTQGTTMPRGILGFGTITTAPFAGEHWARPGHRTNYVDLLWRELLPFDEPVPVSELRVVAPDGPWMASIRQSGRRLTDVAARQLMAYWTAG